MLKLTKIHLIKILMVYTFLTLAAVFCYNITKILGPARKRPFRCFDESLSKPFVVDTVPPQQLYLLGVYFPIAFIVICELCCCLGERKNLTNISWLLKYVLKCGIMLTLFGIGLAVERCLKNVGKIKMSRLRPNFLTVCDPMNTEGLKCKDLNELTIMTDYQCTTNSYPAWALKAAHYSFPSGHTGLASYAMVFLMGYLSVIYRKLNKSSLTMVIILMQISCLLVSVFVGMSRVLDYRHHYTDVMAGFLLGSSVALAVSWYLREQLVNIDKWLKEIMGLIPQELAKSEKIKVSYINDNVSGKPEACALELEDV